MRLFQRQIPSKKGEPLIAENRDEEEVFQGLPSGLPLWFHVGARVMLIGPRPNSAQKDRAAIIESIYQHIFTVRIYYGTQGKFYREAFQFFDIDKRIRKA